MVHSISGRQEAGNYNVSLEVRKEFGERGTKFWAILFSRETQSETNKYMHNTLYMAVCLNCCIKLMLNHFFLQSSYGHKSDICSPDNSASGNHASCSFLPPTITNPDNYTIQVEAQNADGIIKSDTTHWSLDAISKLIFLYTLLFKDTFSFFL